MELGRREEEWSRRGKTRKEKRKKGHFPSACAIISHPTPNHTFPAEFSSLVRSIESKVNKAKSILEC